MNKPLQVGVTGGVGAGKSTVCGVFRTLGVSVYDADDRAKVLMTTDGKLIAAIEKEFGKLAYRDDGTLDRAYLSETVFNSTERLERLNGIVHPSVAEDYRKWVSAHACEPYLIKEAALLVESGSYEGLDKLLVVTAPSALRMQRVLERDPHRSKLNVEQIMRNQMAEERMVRVADFVLKNDESSLILPQILALHDQLLKITN